MNMTKVLRQKLVPQYKDWCVLNVLFLILSMKFFVSDDSVTKEVLGHRKADWSQQLHILVQDIQVHYVVGSLGLKGLGTPRLSKR